MIILRKDQLKLVEPEHPLMNREPKLYDFNNKEYDPVNVSKVLFERMKQLGGVGLSANQVGLDMRVFVMGQTEFGIYVFNPKIIKYKGAEESFNEGCLSFPGIMLMIKRPIAVEVEYQDETGKLINAEYTGLTARIFQHEFDHMMGTNYTNRASKFKMDYAKKKFENKRQKIIKKYAVQTMIDALNKSSEEEKV